eukprot:jgi/Mesen1/8938/ME000552S08450
MGVNNLWSILDNAKVVSPIDELANKSLCVDLSVWVTQLHRAPNNVRGQHISRVERAHVRGLFHRIRHLIGINCRIVFVADGDIPAVKREMYEQRLAGASMGPRQKAPLELHAHLPIALGMLLGSDYAPVPGTACSMRCAKWQVAGLWGKEKLEKAKDMVASVGDAGVLEAMRATGVEALWLRELAVSKARAAVPGKARRPRKPAAVDAENLASCSLHASRAGGAGDAEKRRRDAMEAYLNPRCHAPRSDVEQEEEEAEEEEEEDEEEDESGGGGGRRRRRRRWRGYGGPPLIDELAALCEKYLAWPREVRSVTVTQFEEEEEGDRGTGDREQI